MDSEQIKALLGAIRTVRPPVRKLATFGDTRIEYHLVSSLVGERLASRLREGIVLAEKPRILTADSLKERFEGFGDDAGDYAQLLQEAYRDELRALEYRFRNEPASTETIHEDSRAIAERIKADLDAKDDPLAAVLLAPERGWQLALMKFIVDQSLRSFPTHVRDLDRRGMFDPEGKTRGRAEAEIERLFARAVSDPAARHTLGAKLREYGLFEQYQDRYFALFGR